MVGTMKKRSRDQATAPSARGRAPPPPLKTVADRTQWQEHTRPVAAQAQPGTQRPVKFPPSRCSRHAVGSAAPVQAAPLPPHTESRQGRHHQHAHRRPPSPGRQTATGRAAPPPHAHDGEERCHCRVIILSHFMMILQQYWLLIMLRSVQPPPSFCLGQLQMEYL